MVTDRVDLRRAAEEAGARRAWIDDHGALTYADLHAAVGREADRLRDAGLDPTRGDRVMVTPTLDRASALTMLAALELRATLVLAHPRWGSVEREHAIELARPRLSIRGEDWARRETEPQAAGPAVIVFTSGTTGRPKGVCISRGALLAAADAHADALPWREDNRWLLAMPLAHVGGLGLVVRSVAARRTVVLGPSRFEPGSLLDTARRHEVTLLSLVPTMLERILPAPPPPSVRAVLLGGAACSPALLARGRSLGWPLLPTYGLSECCAQACTQRLDDPRPDGVGPPLAGVEVRVSKGAIEVRGATRMDGFLGEPSLPPDAWYRTGDVGFLDSDGHLHVTGRLDDRIVTGGENVDPLAVETALAEHPAVAGACVVGVDDPEWGQRVSAMIVSRDADDPPSAESLRAHLAAKLAGFAIPRTWMMVSSLPLTPAGKLDRRAARERLKACR